MPYFKKNMTTVTIKNLQELENLVKEFLISLSTKTKTDTATVIALSGDLGAGKTTFVQILAKELGVKEVVNSPTFSIIKKYPINSHLPYKNLVHMDAYRLEGLSELKPLGLFEILADPKSLVCIEWAEKIKDILPKDHIKLSLKIQDGQKREVVCSHDLNLSSGL